MREITDSFSEWVLQQKYSGFGIWESNIDGFIYGERYFETINKVSVKFWCDFEKTKEFEESEALMWTDDCKMS